MKGLAISGYLHVIMRRSHGVNRRDPVVARVRPDLGLSRWLGRMALAGVTATWAVATVAAEPDAPATSLHWSTNAEYSGGDYRWALSRGALDIGLRFDTPARSGPAYVPRLDAAGPIVSNLPAVSLGLRAAASGSDNTGSLLERAAGSAPSTTRSVGIEWKPAQSQLMFIRQGLGIRLSGDDRLTMQLRGGTLGIYMRRDF